MSASADQQQQQRPKYNLKSPGVKRLMREASELAEPTDEYHASPLDDNLFEWHFTVRGPSNTEFEDGLYHGRILLPSQYPMQPPNIILLTPNGRFEINKKICLSISGHHPESWQPSWSIRTALLALIAFMPTPAAGTLGSLDYTKEERRALAKRSRGWECDVCGGGGKLSLSTGAATTGTGLTVEETSLIGRIALKAEEEEETVDVVDDQVDGSTTTTVQEDVDAAPTTATPITVQTNKDMLWSGVMWLLVSAIALLVLRRFFYL